MQVNSFTAASVDNLLKGLPDHRLGPQGLFGKIFSSNQVPTQARQLVIEYINNPACRQSLAKEHAKIVEIFERLRHLPNGTSNWASGLDRELLDAVEELKKENPDAYLESLKINNPFLAEAPKTSAETLPQRVNKPLKNPTPFALTKTTTSPDKRMLFQIHADEFGQSSQWEGGDSEYAVSYLKRFLEVSKYGNPQLREQLDDTVALSIGFQPSAADLSKRIAENKIKIERSITSGKPLLLLGGWTGQPSGHAIYYEIVPQQNGKISFRLYNTGAGSEEHIAGTEGIKTKRYAFTEWTGIDKKRLLDPLFLEALHELKNYTHLPKIYSNTSYGGKDVYEGLKKLLQPEGEKHEFHDEALLMSSQKSGVCSWRSLMAFMRTKLDLEEYKRFKIDIKLQSLSDYIDRRPECTDTEEWRLINKSLRGICQTLLKNQRQNIIGPAYLQSAYEVLKPVAAWLKKHESYRLASINRTDLTYRPYDGISLELDLKEPLVEQARAEVDGNPSTTIKSYKSYFFLPKVTPQNAEAVLKSVNELNQPCWNEGQDLTLHFGIQHFIKNLEISEEYWNKIISNDSAKAERIIIELGKIGTYFNKSCFTLADGNVFDPQKRFVVNKILFIQEMIAGLGHPGTGFERFSLGIGNNKDLNHLYSDPKMNADAAYMNSFGKKEQDKFHIWYSGSWSGAYPVGVEGRADQLYCKIKDRDDFTNYKPFQDLIREMYPQIIQQIASANPKFNEMSRLEQDGHILISPLLPEWVRSMKQQALFYNYFLRQGPAQLKSIDRQNDLEWSMRFHSHKKEGTFELSLKGADNGNRNKGQQEYVYDQFLPIESPVFHKLWTWLELQDTFTEKSILNDLNKEPQHFHELTELKHVLLEDPLQILNAVEFFTKHPNRLKETDFQTLLYCLLFKPGLAESLKNEAIRLHLGRFLGDLYSRSFEENDIPTALYSLRIAYALKAFDPENPVYKNTSNKLIALLEQEELNSDLKCAVYGELIAQLRTKLPLDEGEVTALLAGSIYLNENEKASKYPFNHLQRAAIKESILYHTQAIKEQLIKDGQPNPHILNRVLRALRSDAKGVPQWKISINTSEVIEFTTLDGLYAYRPLQSQLLQKEKPTLLPSEIREHARFKELFPHAEFGIEIANFMNYHGKMTRIYRFRDPAGDYCVKFYDNDLAIEQLVNGKWMRLLISNEPVDTARGGYRVPAYLINHFNLWEGERSNANRILLTDKVTGQKTYEITGERTSHIFIIKGITRIQDQARLGAPTGLLENFEDPGFILHWFDSQGRLSELELPRFKLSFKAQKEGKLECQQMKGFYLNIKDPVPLLGYHQQGVLLENAKGEKKVFLAKQLVQEESRKETLRPEYHLNRKVNERFQEYHVYNLHGNETLHSNSNEANLYLALCLTAAQEYKAAALYLMKFGPKLTHYSKGEQEILTNLANLHVLTGDKSANGTALQLKAAYYLEKGGCSVEPDELLELYSNYLVHYQHVTEGRLLPNEEIFLLKKVLAHQFSPQFYLRLKELDPESAKQIIVKPSKNEKEIFANLWAVHIPQILPLTIYNYPVEPENTPYLLTRLELTERNFLRYYNIAQGDNLDAKLRLRTALEFALITENDNIKGRALLLKMVLDHSDEFPSILLNTPPDQEECQQWIDKVARKVKKFQKGDSHERVSSNIKPQIPVAHSKLDTPSDQKKLEFNFNFSSPFSIAEKSASLNLFEPKKQTVIDTSGLENSLAKLRNDEPVHNQEMQRLIEDVAFYKANQNSFTYFSTPQKIKEAYSLLSEGAETNKRIKTQLETHILSLANATTPQIASQREVEKLAGTYKVITLEELFVLFARKDATALLKRNPSLTDGQIRELMDLTGSYLLYASRDQQKARAEIIFEKLTRASPNTQEYEDLVDQLGSIVMAKRHYIPEENPAFLVFEHFANLLMRKDQVAKLEDFLKGAKPNAVMEMIMGSGKSKILLPLLGLLRADGETLSMVIVPQPLFESVATDTKRILEDAFLQSLKSFHFDRNTQFTETNLQTLLDDLKSIQRNKECLIMTSKSIQCLILKYIEMAIVHAKSGKDTELQIMRNILNLLGKSGYPIIDEVDTVLNVLHEVSFNTGEPKVLKEHEIDLLMELYGTLLDPEFKNSCRLECDPAPNLKAAHLTEALYETVIKEKLAKTFLQKLKTPIINRPELQNKLALLFSKASPQEEALLLAYITKNKDQLEKAQAFFETLDPAVQDVFAFVKEQITHLLPFTLTRTCDEKYGLDPESNAPFAVPFAAVNTPSSGSQFSNPHVTMNYTFQTYLKKGITVDLLREQIKSLQEKAVREVAVSGGKLQLMETEAGKRFNKIRGALSIPLMNYKESQLIQLVDSINRDPKAKRDFVATIVLTQLEIHDKKMSCNPMHLISFYLKACGFTGTLWNSHSMHPKLTPEPEKGTDAKTLSILWANSNLPVQEIKEGTTAEMLGQMKEKGIAFDMLSDAGGYFKEGTNASIADAVKANYGKEVAFYHKNEQAITSLTTPMPLAHSEIKPEDRMTFLDQSHTTGADVPQKRNAVNLVTIGRTMLLRDLLQAVWRTRGIDKSQRVRFLLSQEVKEIICNKLNLAAGSAITLEQILQFVILNQTSQQGKDNFKALKQELANVPQQILLAVLLNEKVRPEAREQAIYVLKSHWVKEADIPSRDLYGKLDKEEPNAKVIAIEEKKAKDQLALIFKKLPWLERLGISEGKHTLEIERLVARMRDVMPKNLTLPSRELDDDQTVEVEKMAQTETDRETDLETSQKTYNTSIILHVLTRLKGFTAYDEFITFADSRIIKNGTYPLFPLKAYFEKKQHPLTNAFEGINIALNLLQFDRYESSGRMNYQLFGPQRTPIHHLLVEKDKVTVLSHEEALKANHLPGYYNLTLGFLDPKQKLTTDQMYKVVKVKFLSGECNYSAEELALLRKWFEAQGYEKMRTFFVNEVLSGQPLLLEAFKNSPLQAALNKG